MTRTFCLLYSGHEKIYSAMEEDARDILRNPVFQEYYTSRNYTHQEP